MPFVPRTLSRAASTVSPSSAGAVDRAGSCRRRRGPAFSAGEPSIGRDDDEDAVGAERGALARRPDADLRADLGADPLELAADRSCRPLAVLLGRQVGRVRVAERVDHALDRARGSRPAGRRRRRRSGRRSCGRCPRTAGTGRLGCGRRARLVARRCWPTRTPDMNRALPARTATTAIGDRRGSTVAGRAAGRPAAAPGSRPAAGRRSSRRPVGRAAGSAAAGARR